MQNYKTGIYFVVGRWFRGRWYSYDVCMSSRVARHMRLRSMDVRRAKLHYLD